MSKLEKSKENAGYHVPALPIIEKEKIGIFMKDWKHVVKYGLNTMNSSVTSFRAGQVIYNPTKLNDYLKLGAPIRVYVRDDE